MLKKLQPHKKKKCGICNLKLFESWGHKQKLCRTSLGLISARREALFSSTACRHTHIASKYSSLNRKASSAKRRIKCSTVKGWVGIQLQLHIRKYHMSPFKRICVFKHSVMTRFNCACPAIQRGQGSGFLSEGSS